jgi:hypothetical protein
MKIQANGMGSSQALSMIREEWSIHCRKGRKLVLGLSHLVCKLTILSASTPSQGGSLHTRRCKDAACPMSHNTMNKPKPIKINPVQNP